jgi:hypothetical protein
MAATHTLTLNPTKITVTGTSENTIDCDALCDGGEAEMYIEWVSGTTVQLNFNDKAITAASSALNSTQTKYIFTYKKSQWIRCKGGAGSETFNIGIF